MECQRLKAWFWYMKVTCLRSCIGSELWMEMSLCNDLQLLRHSRPFAAVALRVWMWEFVGRKTEEEIIYMSSRDPSLFWGWFKPWMILLLLKIRNYKTSNLGVAQSSSWFHRHLSIALNQMQIDLGRNAFWSRISKPNTCLSLMSF